MKQTYLYFGIILLALISSCQESGSLDAKKAQLKEYQNEIKDLQGKVTALEEEIAEEDPTFSNGNTLGSLVTLMDINPDTFRHYISVSGNVASDRNITINAEATAEVQQVKVRKGDKVRKGQLLIVQDADAIRRNIEELKTSLELAETKFKRQSALWDKNIGSEMQFLEAKNGMESLERRLASANTQLKNYRVVAPFDGTIDEVLTKEGEVTMPGSPMLRIVSLSEMYILADVSESYLGEFDNGDSVQVRFPSLKKTIGSTIASVGQVIDQNNRTFEVQVDLPKDESLLRPNLLAVLQITDFQKDDVIVIPTNLIQSDSQGDYVFIGTQVDGTMVAKKKRVERGMTYNNQTMVTSGLSQSDKLIKDGAREVADGEKIRISENALGSSVSFKQ